jgi:hypothetical protein
MSGSVWGLYFAKVSLPFLIWALKSFLLGIVSLTGTQFKELNSMIFRKSMSISVYSAELSSIRGTREDLQV